jgi:hypothetical protein
MGLRPRSAVVAGIQRFESMMLIFLSWAILISTVKIHKS